MAYSLGDILLDATTLQKRIGELAAEIDAAYPDTPQPLVLLTILKGSIFFSTDLSRALRNNVEFEFIAVRSYGGGTTSSGSVELVKDVSMQLRDRDVLMVEDIIDTGNTTSYLYDHIARHEPRSLRLATLLNKPDRRERDVRIDFCGFTIPNEFVVGFGLDMAGVYRNLPDIRLVQDDGVPTEQGANAIASS